MGIDGGWPEGGCVVKPTERRHPSALAGTGAALDRAYTLPVPKHKKTVDPASGYVTIEMPVRPAGDIIAGAMRNLGYGAEKDKPARSMPIPKKRGGDE